MTHAMHILEQLKKPATTDEKLQQLAAEVEQNPTLDITNAAKGIHESLQPQERAAIQTNLDRLHALVAQHAASDTRKVELMKQIREASTNLTEQPASAPARTEVSPAATNIPPAIASKKDGRGIIDRIGDAGTWTSETILGTDRTAEWSPTRKRNVGLLMLGTGIALGVFVARRIARRARSAGNAAHEAANKAGGGWLKKGLILGSISALAFLLGPRIYEAIQKLDITGKLMGGAKDMLAKMQKQMEDVSNWTSTKIEEWKNNALNVVRHPLGGGEGEKYGIDKQKYEEAENIFRHKRENGRGEIAQKCFGLQQGASSPAFEKFWKDMDEKYLDRDHKGIHYARASVALRNYEDNIATAVGELEQWAKDHEGPLLVGTVAGGLLLQRIGALRAILQGGGTVLSKAKDLSVAMLKWNIRHPIISLLGIVGTFATLRALKNSVWLPRNLKELSKVCKQSGDMALDATAEVHAAVLPLQTAMTEVVELAEGSMNLPYQEWIQDQLGKLWGYLTQTIPEKIGESPEQIVEARNRKGIEYLRTHIQQRLQDVPSDEKQVHEDAANKYEKALMLLDAFEKSFVAARRAGGDRTNDRSAEILEELKRILAEILPPIRLETVNGMVRWTGENMPPYDLCVDPAVTDRNELFTLSRNMRQNEDWLTYYLGRTAEHWRLLQSEALKSGKNLAENNAAAMFLGNTLYVIDFENGFVNPRYYTVQWDLVKEIFTGIKDKITGQESHSQITASFTEGAVTCTMFSLSAGVLARIKRFAVGGGPIRPVMHAVKSAIPVASVIQQGTDLFDVYKEVEVYRKLPFLEARRISRICGKAHIRPQWISIVQTSNDYKALENIAGEMGVTGNKDIDLLRKNIIHEMESRIDKVHIHKIEEKIQDILSGRPGTFTGRTGGGKGILGEFKYSFADIKRLLDTRTVTLDELVKANVPVKRLLSEAKATVADLMASGKTVKELVEGGVKGADLIAAGVPLDDIVKAGMDVKKLMDAGKTAAELRAAGVEVKALLQGGVKAADLLSTGAASAAEISAAEKAMRLEMLAKISKTGAAVAGVATGIEALVYFAHTRPAKLKELSETTDPLKRKQIENELNTESIALGLSATSNALMLCPVTAPVGVALFAGNEAKKFVEHSIDEGTRYMLATEKELAQYSSGKILWHVGRSTPISGVSWGQNTVANISGMRQTFRDANEAARHEGYRAYFRQSALFSLPEMTIMDLPEAERQMPREKIQERLAARTQDELGFFAGSALLFLQHETGNQFTQVGPDTLRQATLFARKRTLVYRQDLAQGKSTGRPDERIWDERKAELAEDMRQSETLQANMLADLSRDPSVFEKEAPWRLLHAVQHELADCERRLLETDFSNWESSESWSWIPFKGESEESLREIARGVYGEWVYALIRTSVEQCRNGHAFTPEEIQSAINEMRAFLTAGSPDALARRELRKTDVAYLRGSGADEARLSVNGILALIEQYPLQDRFESAPLTPLKQAKGDVLMQRIGADFKGNYYEVWYANPFNKNLYVLFDARNGTWTANLGSAANYKDPSTFRCNLTGGTDKYNQLLDDLDAINNGREPSQ